MSGSTPSWAEALVYTAMLLYASDPLRALAASRRVPGNQCLQVFSWFDMLLYWRWQFLFPFLTSTVEVSLSQQGLVTG